MHTQLYMYINWKSDMKVSVFGRIKIKNVHRIIIRWNSQGVDKHKSMKCTFDTDVQYPPKKSRQISLYLSEQSTCYRPQTVP